MDPNTLISASRLCGGVRLSTTGMVPPGRVVEWPSMDVALAAAIAFLTAFLAGSLPLGARLVERVSGWAPREVNPHLLGVENVTRLVGGGVALAAFGLDLFKGMLGLAAGVMAGWLFTSLAYVGALTGAPGFDAGGPLAVAASERGLVAALAAAGLLGVVAGHLAPLPLPGIAVAPRGRGNGVALGGLAGLYAFGAAPLWLVAVPVAAWAAVLAWRG